jgi:hypothetical protein
METKNGILSPEICWLGSYRARDCLIIVWFNYYYVYMGNYEENIFK